MDDGSASDANYSSSWYTNCDKISHTLPICNVYKGNSGPSVHTEDRILQPGEVGSEESDMDILNKPLIHRTREVTMKRNGASQEL